MSTAKKVQRLMAMAGALALTGLAAAPVQAGVKDNQALDFQGKTSKYVAGLSCAAVPTTDGGRLPLTMMVTSDSSRRVATVRYSLGGGVVLGDTSYPVGEGRITVLKAGQTLGAPEITAARPGPPARKRDLCSYSNPGANGWAQLVHRTSVTRPKAAEVMAWCETQSWFQYSPESCPDASL